MVRFLLDTGADTSLTIEAELVQYANGTKPGVRIDGLGGVTSTEGAITLWVCPVGATMAAEVTVQTAKPAAVGVCINVISHSLLRKALDCIIYTEPDMQFAMRDGSTSPVLNIADTYYCDLVVAPTEKAAIQLSRERCPRGRAASGGEHAGGYPESEGGRRSPPVGGQILHGCNGPAAHRGGCRWRDDRTPIG